MKKAIFSLLALALCIPVASTTVEASDFGDVEGHWAKESINWATNLKMVQGYEDGSFRPDELISQEEFLALFIRTNPKDQDTMNEDIKGATWSDRYYQSAAQLHMVIQSDMNERTKPITRGQAAQLITGTFGFHYSVDGSIAYLYDRGISSGKKAKTLDGFDKESGLTRAEAVQFLKILIEKLPTRNFQNCADEEEENPSIPKYYGIPGPYHMHGSIASRTNMFDLPNMGISVMYKPQSVGRTPRIPPKGKRLIELRINVMIKLPKEGETQTTWPTLSILKEVTTKEGNHPDSKDIFLTGGPEYIENSVYKAISIGILINEKESLKDIIFQDPIDQSTIEIEME
ncbi:S-layer homology domain-containing protein [Paenibacillus sp. SI8]|uniref:S-layer homology domain-containing protein n=1 Tax=unclassified Paenibacillus TaxID=185978 RepID=UPI0034663069